jgi:hypothetical protein
MGVLLLAAFAFTQTTQANANIMESAVAPEIEGTWLVTVTIPDGPPPFPALVSYARGGVLTTTDGGTAPALGHVYQGTWARTGSREFAFTFLGLQYDAQGVFTNYFRVRETVRLSRNGNAYNGEATFEVLDTAMNVIATGSLTTHATRVLAR